jgi:hypothetical protein
MLLTKKYGTFAVVACTILLAASCGGSVKAKKELIYSFKLEKTASIIAGQAHACSSQLRSYWAIWEYAKVSEMDFETAAREMGGGHRQQNLSMMRSNKAEIDRLLSDLASPEEEYIPAFNKLKELHAAYVKIHDQALKPSGDWENLEKRIRDLENGVNKRLSEFQTELAALNSER